MMIKLELSEQHVQIIADVLVRQPYASVAPVITELQKQIGPQLAQQAQQQAAAPANQVNGAPIVN